MSSNEPVTPASQIQQVISDIQKPTEFPLEVKLETGQVYRGTTPQEVLDQLIRAQTEASRTITAERQQLQIMQAEIERMKQATPAPPANATEAEKQNYYNTWAQDPDKAFDMQLAKRFGVTPEIAADMLRRSVQDGVVKSAADEFLSRCPDFPQESAPLIQARMLQRYGNSPGSTTADNLEIVYHQLVREGAIQPKNLAFQGTTEHFTPNPQLRGSGAPPNPVNDIMMQAQTMKMEDLKAVIQRLEAQGVR